MGLKHVLLKNTRLKGYEYGVLRAMEHEIVEQTQAEVIDVPDYGVEYITRRTGHGMRWDNLRSILPKKSFKVEADVIWYILMGPENYELDLFKDWEHKARYRIVYLFDTLEPQFSLVKKLFSSQDFNICITSFKEAVDELESATGKKWHAIEQAVPESLFNYVPPENKLIDFSSYGRRLESFHNILIEFCKSNGLYYDYSTSGGGYYKASNEELYKHYAWHVSHSQFTISWPVELTNPHRAGRLSPVTCRWFEAAASGTIILGKKPANESFDDLLAPDLVIEINPNADKRTIWNDLEYLYINRVSLNEKAEKIRSANSHRWIWKDRVNRIIEVMNLEQI